MSMRAFEFTRGNRHGFQRFINENNDSQAMTARMAGPLMLPVALLGRFIGSTRPLPELTAKAEAGDLDNEGQPVVFAIDAEGKPAVTHGAATVAAAVQAGVAYLHVEAQWYGGSDQMRDIAYSPSAISRAAHWGEDTGTTPDLSI